MSFYGFQIKELPVFLLSDDLEDLLIKIELTRHIS